MICARSQSTSPFVFFSFSSTLLLFCQDIWQKRQQMGSRTGLVMRMVPSRKPLALASSGSHAKTKTECIWTATRRGGRLRKSPEGHSSTLEKGTLEEALQDDGFSFAPDTLGDRFHGATFLAL